MEPERALRIGWRVWPFAAVAIVTALVVFGLREDREGEEGAVDGSTTESPALDRPVVPAPSASASVVLPPPDERDEDGTSVEPAEEAAPGAPAPIEPVTPGATPVTADAPSLEQRARSLLSGWEDRFEQAVERTVDAARDVDVERLAEHGRRVGRFVPFVGPYLRYDEARALYRTGEPGARERARRQMVVALADLVLDAGSAGLSKTASGSSGVAAALDGAVDLAELGATALAIRDVLGDESAVEALAGRALDEIDGLDAVVEELLTLDVRHELDDWRAGLTERGRALVEAVEETLRADR